MTTISIILFGLFVGLLCYLVGLHRGNQNNAYEYDRGYEDGMNDALAHGEDIKYTAAKELVRQLDELFDLEDKDEEEEL